MENLKIKSVEAEKVIHLFWRLSAAKAFAGSLFVATCVLFFIERGINLFEVNIIILTTAIITFVFEVPTGAIADLFGRKVSCVCAYFMLALGLFIYAISNSLFGFVIAATIEAVAFTMLSGALEAWFVDSLDHNSYEPKKTGIYAVNNQIEIIAGIVGVLIGSFLSGKDSALPWFLASSVMCMVGIVAIIFMKEDYFVKQNVSFKTGIGSMKETMKTSVKYVRNSRTVRFVLLTGMLLAFVIQAPNAQYQPLFIQFVPNKMWLGYLWTAMSIAAFGGSRLSVWFSSKLENRRKELISLQVTMGLGIFLAGVFAIFQIILATFVAFLFWIFVERILIPIRKDYLNENISSQERATIISLMSMTATTGSAVGLLLGGLLAKHFSIPVAWIVAGAMLMILTLLLMKNGNNKIENEAT